MMKIFGIGNILLGDDGVGVRVVEKIKEEIKNISEDIDVIIGETDYLYCLDQIEQDDTIVIIDSTYLDINAGYVSYFDLKDCNRFIKYFNSQHESNLVKSILIENLNVKGYLIGIEIGKVDFSLELSKAIKDNFYNICLDVLKYIKEIYKEYARSINST